ncbi:MAG: carbohydrate ABC transporter permease [Caldilineaceae bacterium SB0675_bin_29]|uniref:Carbohydrate ABC transporter permease n=1 Tax=Caldilineaceae bacterium SB0675_bin_29 TaxID=2605266 RepID=A0A6B1G333_9CHLR|nr:carbohydrate ABC transporter permease [Caldilineaceae bacterium SB0675_bin_29]
MLRDQAVGPQPTREIHPGARGQPLRRLLELIGTQLHLVLGAIVFALPFVWMVSTSLKADRQIFAFPPIWVPDPFIWGNFPAVFIYAPMHLYFFNTLLIALAHVFGAVFTCSLAAYGFARLRAPGRDLIFMVMVSQMMIPYIVMLVPLYLLFAELEWIDTFYPLTIPAMLGTPFYIFMLRQFFLTIPMELEEAAIIDGASRLRIWWTIILPLAKPALATVAIFSFMFAWNDFTGPLIFLNSREKFTLSLGLQAFMFERRTMWGPLMAASTMMIMPILIVFFLAQKHFIQGIALTGIKA